MANTDLDILLFSVFALVVGIALTVAGIAMLRAGVWSDWRRGVLLACGLLPITAIPVGAAVGDTPHFTANACWGSLLAPARVHVDDISLRVGPRIAMPSQGGSEHE